MIINKKYSIIFCIIGKKEKKKKFKAVKQTSSESWALFYFKPGYIIYHEHVHLSMNFIISLQRDLFHSHLIYTSLLISTSNISFR